jgi:hypothetical protein
VRKKPTPSGKKHLTAAKKPGTLLPLCPLPQYYNIWGVGGNIPIPPYLLQMTWDKDKNNIYEDDDIIVLLATDKKNPNETVKNCKRYGVGLTICIGNSSGKTFCYEDRWIKKTTVYFVWLKEIKKFILIDALPDGIFSYNNIGMKMDDGNLTDNFDIKDKVENIILKYPVLKMAFEKNIFKSIPLQVEEINFFQRLENASSIFDFKNLGDMLDCICLPSRVITEEEWELVLRYKYGKRLFKEFITTRSLKPFNYRDVPEFVLEYYPSLQHRYWNKVKNDAVINMRINILYVLTQHEKKSFSEFLKDNKNKTLQNNKLNPILFLKKFLFKLFGIKLQKHKQRLKNLLYSSNYKDSLGLLQGMIFLPCL